MSYEYFPVENRNTGLKVNGKKLYELAREGKTVERKPRPVHFYEIEILDISFPLVRFRVTCSKGTYIRPGILQKSGDGKGEIYYWGIL